MWLWKGVGEGHTGLFGIGRWYTGKKYENFQSWAQSYFVLVLKQVKLSRATLEFQVPAGLKVFDGQ